MLKIYRRGQIWHYRGSVAGRRLRGSTGAKDKTIAERVKAEIEARYWKGHLDGPASVLTFAQASIIYRNRQVGASDRFLNHVEDYWRDTPVKEITAAAIRQACQEIYPTCGPATWNRQVIVPTQAIINFASEQELCPPIRVRRFKVVTREKDPASLTWVTAFQSKASPHLGALASFMFFTGARISEAMSLSWAEVDFGTRVARIRMGKTGGTERLANLPPPLVIALANIPGPREGRVFKFKNRHCIKTQWELAIKKAGIKRLTPHSMRHGFATSMLQAGIDPVSVARAGGWRDTAMLWKTYGHARDDIRLTDVLTADPQGAQSTPNNPKRIDKITA